MSSCCASASNGYHWLIYVMCICIADATSLQCTHLHSRRHLAEEERPTSCLARSDGAQSFGCSSINIDPSLKLYGLLYSTDTGASDSSGVPCAYRHRLDGLVLLCNVYSVPASTCIVLYSMYT